MVTSHEQHGWQLEANSAEAYERYLVPAIFRASAGRLADLLALGPGDRVVDVACGTGIVARIAAERVGPTGSVTGVDLNEQMLGVARASEPAVEWVEADATALPLPDGAFDAVTCQQGLAFMPEPVAALREMLRVTATGGRIGVVVCRPLARNGAYAALADALERHAGGAAGAIMRSPFPGWSVADLHALMGDAGARDLRVRIDVAGVRYPSVEELVRREAASSPLAAQLAALDAHAVAALVAQVAEALFACTDDDGVVVPLETHVALARR